MSRPSASWQFVRMVADPKDTGNFKFKVDSEVRKEMAEISVAAQECEKDLHTNNEASP